MTRIKAQNLAPAGHDKIAWVKAYMPLLNAIEKDFVTTMPFSGLKIAISIHLEAKTAYLTQVLRAGGAQVAVTGCNPLSTQDDVAAALAENGIAVHAVHGASEAEYKSDLLDTLAIKPHLIIDDGGDFTSLLHNDYCDLSADLFGGCEETTTGIMRLKTLAKSGELLCPMIAVNDADCKHLFDNRYGTGQSTMTAIMAVTNLSIASRTVVIAGYGWCGRGIALRARGMGANIIVTEINPIKAIEAVMDGFRVMTMDEAAVCGDVFITATGCCDVITARHFECMKDGALLANSGHFDVEISKPDLKLLATQISQRKPDICGYTLKNGKTLNLVAEGRLVNLAAGMGHPVEIMDMSFAIQARCLEYLAKHGNKLSKNLHNVPREIDQNIAFAKLATMKIDIDKLSIEQEKYYYNS